MDFRSADIPEEERLDELLSCATYFMSFFDHNDITLVRRSSVKSIPTPDNVEVADQFVLKKKQKDRKCEFIWTVYKKKLQEPLRTPVGRNKPGNLGGFQRWDSETTTEALLDYLSDIDELMSTISLFKRSVSNQIYAKVK